MTWGSNEIEFKAPQINTDTLEERLQPRMTMMAGSPSDISSQETLKTSLCACRLFPTVRHS